METAIDSPVDPGMTLSGMMSFRQIQCNNGGLNMFHIAEIGASIIGYTGILFIFLGFILSLKQYVSHVIWRKYSTDHVRHTLGTYILIGLEFMVGQDIVETVLHTDRDHLINLGLIVIIRTVLDFFLSREITHLGERIKKGHHGE